MFSSKLWFPPKYCVGFCSLCGVFISWYEHTSKKLTLVVENYPQAQDMLCLMLMMHRSHKTKCET